MRHAIHILALVLCQCSALGQIRSNPALIVQEDDSHFEALVKHQGQIKDRYNKKKLALPHFGDWVRVESEASSKLFPNLSFYSISWSESLHPDAGEKLVSLAFGLEKTVGLRSDTGKLEASLFCTGNYEAFGELLVKNKVDLQNQADARTISKSFCEIHHRHWQEQAIKRISDKKWHLGVSSYDQTVSTTDKTKTLVTRAHYFEVLVDPESNAILSWESKVDTSNRRSVPK